VQYEYDCLGKKTLEKKKINDNTYKITRFEYSSAGRLKKVIEEYDGKDLAGEEKGTVKAETLFEYEQKRQYYSGYFPGRVQKKIHL